MVCYINFSRCDGTTENLAGCLKNRLVALVQFIAKINENLLDFFIV